MKITVCKRRASVLAALCIFAFFIVSMQGACVQAEAAGVSAGEKKKIQKLIDDTVIQYIKGACNYPAKLERFVFNAKMKTDIAFHNVAYKKHVFRQFSSEQRLMEKYLPYAGVYKYTDSVKAAVKKQGRALFGESFQISFAVGDGFSTSSNYPLSHDKKYVLMNFTDWGDWYANHKYQFTKQGSLYRTNLAVASYWGGAEEEITVYQFHVDLHKNKKSYIIKDIVFEKQIDT